MNVWLCVCECSQYMSEMHWFWSLVHNPFQGWQIRFISLVNTSTLVGAAQRTVLSRSLGPHLVGTGKSLVIDWWCLPRDWEGSVAACVPGACHHCWPLFCRHRTRTWRWRSKDHLRLSPACNQNLRKGDFVARENKIKMCSKRHGF